MTLTTFKEAHTKFIEDHLSRRTGERRARLERGHRHGEPIFLENIWWPMHGNFDNLHPEYEVLDWRGFPYYIDLAYILPHIKIGWEIKGYNAHVLNSDRTKYRNELNRETFLKAIGWRIINIPADDVIERPQTIRMLIQMFLSQYSPGLAPIQRPSVFEAETLKLACNLGRPLKPIDVEKHFAVNHRTSLQWIKLLCEKGWMKPLADSSRIAQYIVVKDVMKYWP